MSTVGTLSNEMTPARSAHARGERAIRILAKSTFRELKTGGLSQTDIVNFASELLGLVSDDIEVDN